MVKSQAPEIVSGRITAPPVDWELDHEEKDFRTRFTISSERGERHVICPTSQARGVMDVLLGHEYPVPLTVRDFIRGMPVVDIGAHVGSANVYFDEILKPSKIISFEPNPTSLEYLKANCNGSTTIVPAAVTNHMKGAALSTPPAVRTADGTVVDRDLCCSSTYPFIGETEGFEKIEVPTIDSCSALNMAGEEIGLLKVDAELSELDILLHAQNGLRHVRVIFLEYHTEILRRQCDSLLCNFRIFFADGHFRQGVVGYLREDLANQLPGNVYF